MIYLAVFLITFAVAYVTNPSRKSPIYAIFVMAFTFQYSSAVAGLLLNIDNSNIYAAWEYRLLALFLVSLAFVAAGIVILTFKPRLAFPENLRVQYSQLNMIVAALSVVGIFLLTDVTELVAYAERLTSRAGSGFVYIFGFLAFGAALNFALFPPGKRPKWSWFVLVAAIVFFIIAGYRSLIMLCLVALALSFFGLSTVAGRSKFALFAAILTVVAGPINFITGAIRSLASSQRSEISYESVVDLASTLAEQQTIPMANAHLDTLALYLQTASDDEKWFGTASTFLASITNFLPRTLFPDKGETTGVVMARQIFPEWFYSGEHTSSVTVGLIFEMIFNFGMPVGILLFVAFVALACSLFKAFIRIPIYGAYFAPFLAWCFFFNIFFDDLGGIVNKVVLVFIGSALVMVLHQLRPRGAKRFAREPAGSYASWNRG